MAIPKATPPSKWTALRRDDLENFFNQYQESPEALLRGAAWLSSHGSLSLAIKERRDSITMSSSNPVQAKAGHHITGWKLVTAMAGLTFPCFLVLLDASILVTVPMPNQDITRCDLINTI